MTVTIHTGDCRDVMHTMAADSVDAVVCDPPYGLAFMGKGWDHAVPSIDYWTEALRVAKPGAHLLAFGGTRTFHRMVCAIEDAGWEIRDRILWLYGSGFPKSLDVSKAIDKAAGAKRDVPGRHEAVGRAVGIAGNDGRCITCGKGRGGQPGNCQCDKEGTPVTDAARTWQGWGTALKPAHEPIIVARKPLIGTVAANVLAHGTGALNIDGCRVPTTDGLSGGAYATHGTERGDGWGMQRAGAGEYVQPTGRWPANVIHDGSDEVLAGFPTETGPSPSGPIRRGDRNTDNVFGRQPNAGGTIGYGYSDHGSAARFFYCAKADRADRNDGCDGLPLHPSGMVSNTSGQHITRRDGGAPAPSANNHPTVKPTDLMRYLCRLVTPPGGLVLDPFMGSGSTGRAAVAEGFSFVGIELDTAYVAIARARIGAMQPGLSLAMRA